MVGFHHVFKHLPEGGLYEKMGCNLDNVWGLCDWTIDGLAKRPSCRHVQGKAIEYILATAKAARTVYVKGVIADAKKAGVKLNEDWVKDDHAIMLPAQFVKEVRCEVLMILNSR